MDCTASHDDCLALDFNNINLSSTQSENLTIGAEEVNKKSGSIDHISIPNDSPESITKLYPHLYSTILQGQTSLLRENANQSLAALFPSVLTAEGPKCKNELSSILATTNNTSTTLNATNSQSSVTGSVAAELSQALSTALSLSASEAAIAGTVTATYKDTLPRSDLAVTQTNLISCNNEIVDTNAKSASFSINGSSSTLITDITTSTCATAKKRKHQTPVTTSCTPVTTVHSTNVTLPGRTSSESNSSTSSAKETKQEIGPVTLGDALQQKIRETQAKIKSNVISASSSQSLLPPGKCNSHHNHQTGSKELNQLLHQHYCGRKAPKAPSASAVRKGKVPPPPGSTNVSPQSAKTSSPTPGPDSTLDSSGLPDKTAMDLQEDCDR